MIHKERVKLLPGALNNLGSGRPGRRRRPYGERHHLGGWRRPPRDLECSGGSFIGLALSGVGWLVFSSTQPHHKPPAE
jgi:hypothetical protein